MRPAALSGKSLHNCSLLEGTQWRVLILCDPTCLRALWSHLLRRRAPLSALALSGWWAFPWHKSFTFLFILTDWLNLDKHTVQCWMCVLTQTSGFLLLFLKCLWKVFHSQGGTSYNKHGVWFFFFILMLWFKVNSWVIQQITCIKLVNNWII